MQTRYFISLLACAALLTAGCGKSAETQFSAEDVGKFPDTNLAESLMRISGQKERSPYLAYEHDIRIEVDEDALAASFLSAVKKCTDDAVHGCEILESNLNTGDYASASIELRVKREGVAGLIEAAAEGNKIVSQNVSAEDLAAPILDNEKRRQMLESYQKRLMELESRSAKDVESLIKIASEIAKTQSELEGARGENEYLMKRVNLDLLSIHFTTDAEDSFLRPIGDALEDFAYNLSEGLAITVTAIAYLIPWIALLTGLFFVWRRIWRRRNKN